MERYIVSRHPIKSLKGIAVSRPGVFPRTPRVSGAKRRLLKLFGDVRAVFTRNGRDCLPLPAKPSTFILLESKLVLHPVEIHVHDCRSITRYYCAIEFLLRLSSVIFYMTANITKTGIKIACGGVLLAQANRVTSSPHFALRRRIRISIVIGVLDPIQNGIRNVLFCRPLGIYRRTCAQITAKVKLSREALVSIPPCEFISSLNRFRRRSLKCVAYTVENWSDVATPVRLERQPGSLFDNWFKDHIGQADRIAVSDWLSLIFNVPSRYRFVGIYRELDIGRCDGFAFSSSLRGNYNTIFIREEDIVCVDILCD